MGCGTVISGAKQLAVEAFYEANKVTPQESEGLVSRFRTIVIEVYFHVFNAGPGLDNGDVTDKQIKNQMDVINRDFAEAGFEFVLMSTDRTTDAHIFYYDGYYVKNRGIKLNHKKGGIMTLNVYTVRLDDFAGFSSFPWDYEEWPWNDGILLHWLTLPGGTLLSQSMGRTLTHEIGHWLGLYHTFEGGCFGKGDFVTDTPPSQSPSIGCPVGRQSCGRFLDPIHNFMDNSDDSCMTHFTRGQILRMRSMFATFRQYPGTLGSKIRCWIGNRCSHY